MNQETVNLVVEEMAGHFGLFTDSPQTFMAGTNMEEVVKFVASKVTMYQAMESEALANQG